MKTLKLFIAATLLTGTFVSCKKDNPDPDPTAETGTLRVEMTHLWGMSGDQFVMGQDLIHPMNLDTMNFTTMKYYISNFRLKKSDGTWWTHPESYFLVDLSNPSTVTLDLGSLPTGEYTQMEYVLGVDSLRNVSGAQTGALSTTNNMFWSWNTGYIMIKAEGTSPNSGTGSFAFHLGGYSGTYNVVTTKTIDFGSNPLTVSKSNNPTVYISGNPAKLFHQDPLSSGTSVMMPGAKAQQMALNFYSSFALDHIVE
jgi:hypothetical protein